MTFCFGFLTSLLFLSILIGYPFFGIPMRFLVTIQVIVALFLIVSILLQSRGDGMSISASGGNYYAKRGFEKFLLYASAGLAFLFVFLAGLNAYLTQKF